MSQTKFSKNASLLIILVAIEFKIQLGILFRIMTFPSLTESRALTSKHFETTQCARFCPSLVSRERREIDCRIKVIVFSGGANHP